MSEQGAGQDLVAVALVVEGSIVVASEWTRLFAEYILPLLKRLHDLHSNHQVCWFAESISLLFTSNDSFD